MARRPAAHRRTEISRADKTKPREGRQSIGDHRAAYLDYEGEVSGGRGSVRRVDGGNYERLLWTDDLVRARLNGAQLVGVVELRRTEAGGWGAGVEESGPWSPSREVGSGSSSWTFLLGNLA